MQDMEVFWLRAATALYSTGLFHSAYTVLRKRSEIFKPVLAVFCVATVLHMVSLVDTAIIQNHFPANNFAQSISLFAFLIASRSYSSTGAIEFQSLSVFIFPLVFVMTLVATMQGAGIGWSGPTCAAPG